MQVTVLCVTLLSAKVRVRDVSKGLKGPNRLSLRIFRVYFGYKSELLVSLTTMKSEKMIVVKSGNSVTKMIKIFFDILLRAFNRLKMNFEN